MFKVAFNEQFCDFYDLVKSMKPVIGWTNTFAYILCQYADKVDGINIVHGRLPIKSSDDTVTIVSCGFDSGKNPTNGSKSMLWTMQRKCIPITNIIVSRTGRYSLKVQRIRGCSKMMRPNSYGFLI